MSQSFLALTIGALLLAGVAAFAAEVTPGTNLAMATVLNVKDLGAVGDGKADDTAALQHALDTAGQANPATPGTAFPNIVFLPAGTYRVTKTLQMGHKQRVSQIVGAGATTNISKFGYTTVLWDGAKGEHLFNVAGYLGLRISELRLDGNKKAGILLRINSIPGVGTGLWYLERLHLVNADKGCEFGADMDACASDMTFVDCNFGYMTTAAFHTRAGQNVDYVFIRCIATWSPIGFYFEKGGVGHFILPAFGRVRTGIKIDAGGINGGVFSVTGLQCETFNYDSEKKRFTILEANGETNVSMSAIYTGCGNIWGDTGDYTTPNFILGPGAQVSIRDSMISGKIATIKGLPQTNREAQTATWLQFDNCRFRCAADPLKDIESDDYSGFEFRNCQVSVDNTKAATADEYYATIKPRMIRSYTKYPKIKEHSKKK